MKYTFTLISLFTVMIVKAQTIHYVDSSRADNSGAGTSWATAKRDIQEAIALALAGDEVWVKKGTYKPTVRVPGGSAERDVSFQMKDGIKLYGGFAGTETLLLQRNLNITANRTILSGDIGNLNDTNDNCRHVIVASAAITNTTIIDAFTITKGVAGRSGFTGNFYGAYGGGMYNVGAPVLSNLIFTENFAVSYGGGFYNEGTPAMTNITFDSNYSYENGGGLCNFPPGHPSMSNCTFTGNRAETFGGAILNMSTMTLHEVSFFSNSSEIGGAIHSQQSIAITNARFRGNAASEEGGAISNYSALINLSNVAFSDNTAGNGGGALSTRGDTTSVISNVLFTRNSSSNGSAVRIYSNGKATFNNCTFSKNTSSSSSKGGAIYISANAGSAINNCILWNNETPSNSNGAHREEIYSDNMATKIQVNNSIVRDATGSPLGVTNATLTNCSNKDPMFFDIANPIGTDSIGMTSDDGLALQPCSPAINTGITTTPAMPADMLGNNRVDSYDIGAYEYQGAATLPILATAGVSLTTIQLGTTTYGNCAGIIATIAAGAQTSSITGSTTAKVWVEASTPATWVKRHYEITPDNNAATATGRVTLYFTQAEFDAFNALNMTKLPTGSSDAAGKANLLIEKRPGTSSNSSGLPLTYNGTPVTTNPADNDIVWNNQLSRWEVTVNVTGFSGFFVKTIEAPLPVTWLSISGRLNAHQNAVISWHVAERSVANYDVEVSSDGREFSRIGRIPGKGDGENRYSFTAHNSHTGNNYYRIRQADIDGEYSYSSIVNVSAGAPVTAILYPNPAIRAVTLETGPKLMNTPAQLIDMSGKMVRQWVIRSQQTSVDLSGLSSGIYLLQLNDGQVLRITKH